MYRGGTSWFLTRLMQVFGLVNCSLHACDTFIGHVQEDLVAGLDRYLVGHFVDTNAALVQAQLSTLAFEQKH